jgi:hypothetical protein
MEKKRLQKKTDKHILSVKNCIHKYYLLKTSIMGATYIHCRTCESKWASYERWYIKYILDKININFVHIQSILNYIGLNQIIWNTNTIEIIKKKISEDKRVRNLIFTMPVNPYNHDFTSKPCLCIKCQSRVKKIN